MKRVTAVLPALLVALTGCGQEDIASPALQQTGVSLAAANDPNAWLYHVTGGGHAFDKTIGFLGEGQVNVTQNDDGAVSGRFAFHSRFAPGRNVNDAERGVQFVAEADCMVVEGNTAWISGVVVEIKDFDFPVPPPPLGVPYLVVVEDNGGNNDRAFFGAPFQLGVTDCNDRPAIPGPPDASADGNFTIHRR